MVSTETEVSNIYTPALVLWEPYLGWSQAGRGGSGWYRLPRPYLLGRSSVGVTCPPWVGTRAWAEGPGTCGLRGGGGPIRPAWWVLSAQHPSCRFSRGHHKGRRPPTVRPRWESLGLGAGRRGEGQTGGSFPVTRAKLRIQPCLKSFCPGLLTLPSQVHLLLDLPLRHSWEILPYPGMKGFLSSSGVCSDFIVPSSPIYPVRRNKAGPEPTPHPTLSVGPRAQWGTLVAHPSPGLPVGRVGPRKGQFQGVSPGDCNPWEDDVSPATLTAQLGGEPGPPALEPGERLWLRSPLAWGTGASHIRSHSAETTAPWSRALGSVPPRRTGGHPGQASGPGGWPGRPLPSCLPSRMLRAFHGAVPGLWPL